MRIASLSPAATETLFALGCGKEIVCVDQFSNFPEEAKGIAHLKGHTDVNPEDLETHKPDIVFTATIIQEKLAKELRTAGFTVIHQDPRTLPTVTESIRAIGAILDREAAAKELILKNREGWNDVQKKAAFLPRKPRVYVEEWHDPPMVSGNWVPEVLRLAGALSFPIMPGELSRAVSFEDIQRFNPDLVVISWCGAGSLGNPKLLTGRSGWGNLPAIQDGRVRVIDDSLLNRPGPRLLQGAQRIYGWLFEMMH